MKRVCFLLAAVAGVAAVITGVAVAASSSPTAQTHSATSISTNQVVLRGAVDPNGRETSFAFQYGPTSSYGLNTPSHSAGDGTKLVPVHFTLAGLTPGTKYHFRLAALSKGGVAFGGDHVFKTKGAPPASVVTGPPVAVGKYQATVTGSINPEGESTTWSVLYGLTLPYPARTVNQTPLAPVVAPLPVSVTLTGLAPGKLYHYQIVASHRTFPSFGADATFFTLPGFRRKPNMTTRTSPSRVRRKPYVFTTAGTLHGANFVPANLRCTGRVGVRYYNGRHQVAFELTPVGSNCKFSTPVPFKRLIGGGPTRLSVKITYRGNGYLRSVEKTNHVTLG
jgi:hypothetical protein